MINKTGNVAVEGWINDLAILRSHHVRAGRSFIFLDAFLANGRVLVEDFTHVLHQEGASLDALASSQAPALVQGLHWVDVCVLVGLKPSVHA